MGSVKRILCYGDSLTAGFWACGQKFEPYAKTLKKELESLGIIVEIDQHGFSGWTTEELLARSDYNKLEDFTGHKGPGLKKALTSQNYDLLILMAGTNDLSNKSDTFIFDNLKKLTEIAISAKMAIHSLHGHRSLSLSSILAKIRGASGPTACQISSNFVRSNVVTT